MAANQSVPPRQTLMEAVVDNRGGLFGGRTVFICGYSVGIKYGDYMHRHGDEDQCDEAEEYDESKMLKIGRMKKVGKRGFTKGGDCVAGKHGLGTGVRC